MIKHPYDIERCKKECAEIAEKYGYPLTIPVQQSHSASIYGCVITGGEHSHHLR